VAGAAFAFAFDFAAVHFAFAFALGATWLSSVLGMHGWCGSSRLATSESIGRAASIAQTIGSEYVSIVEAR
jgi:hypothetical protein